MESEITLVTPNDHAVGICPKIYAHQHGLLHRAFSIFIHKKVEQQIFVLLQKRHPSKYHSGNLWTNTCCSHPRPYETLEEATNRRLQQEMGIQTLLIHQGSFVYRHQFSNGLIEHELDHVWTGEYQEKKEKIEYDPQEICEIRWASLEQIHQELIHTSYSFTPWFRQAFSVAYPSLRA
jgi:isopentenyl-diphosphate delta-isomerase type 1